jgi:hypothetical protein
MHGDGSESEPSLAICDAGGKASVGPKLVQEKGMKMLVQETGSLIVVIVFIGTQI